MRAGYVPFGLNLSRRKWDEESQSRPVIHINRAYHVILAISVSVPEQPPNPSLDFIGENSAIFVEDCQPSSQIPVVPSMVLQAGNSKRSRVSLPVKQEWFAPAKMRYPGTPDFFREMPICPTQSSIKFFFPMMPPDMLQIGHDNLEFSALSHRSEQNNSTFRCRNHANNPGVCCPHNSSSIPFFERDNVAPACEGPGTKNRRVHANQTPASNAQLLRVKIKMRQPRWNFGGICRDGNLAPENLKIDVRADLWSKVAPDNRV